MKEEISIQAKLVKECIHMATATRLIGPKIKTGRLQRKIVEPAWKCPDRYHMLRINMKQFQMELLTPPIVGSGDIVLQLHGGGYINKLRNIYRNFAKNYSDMRQGMKVLSVDYRVAPENPYPAALLDAVTAYQWLLNLGYQGGQIILAGDSAGGGLALALSMWIRDHGIDLPKALVLMSPWTDLTASGVSYEENYTKDPMFGNTRESMIYNGEYPGTHDLKEPYISPLFGDFQDLPPMLFQAGSIEMLRSDAEETAKKAEEAGCQVKLSVYEGMFHVFQMGLSRIPESESAWNEVREFIEGLPETEMSTER